MEIVKGILNFCNAAIFYTHMIIQTKVILVS